MSGEITRFVQYWQTPGVRERVNETRRQRYREDAKGREAKLATTRTHVPVVRPRRDRGPNKPQVIRIEGTEVVLLSLGDAARRLCVSKQTLRCYDDRHVIPRNRRIDEFGRRWYPLAFIDFLAPFFASQRSKKAPLWRLKARVEGAWAGATGIPVLHEETEHDHSG